MHHRRMGCPSRNAIMQRSRECAGRTALIARRSAHDISRLSALRSLLRLNTCMLLLSRHGRTHVVASAHVCNRDMHTQMCYARVQVRPLLQISFAGFQVRRSGARAVSIAPLVAFSGMVLACRRPQVRRSPSWSLMSGMVTWI